MLVWIEIAPSLEKNTEEEIVEEVQILENQWSKEHFIKGCTKF